jgi:hypothetical protein
VNLDVDAIAEGICDSAPGSTIELLLDLLDALIDDGAGGIVHDAVQYRGYDSAGEPSTEPDDVDCAAEYLRVNEQLEALRAAIAGREAAVD